MAANLIQAYVFVHLFRRWLPHLWGGGDRPLARLGELWRLIGGAGLSRADLAGRWASTGRRHRFEYLAVVLLSAAYTVAFGLDHDLPLAFPLLVMTVWAGLRLHTGFVIVHDVVFGSAAMLFTLARGGPFAGDDLGRARFVVVACRRGSSPSSGVGRALTNDQGVNSFRDPLTSAETAAAHCPTTLAPRSSARSATP